MSIDVTDKVTALKAALEDKPNGVLEDVARQFAVATRQVIDALPLGMQTCVDGSHFEAVMTDVTAWGDVTFLVHTGDVIVEYKGAVPPGRFARGYYNLEGGALGGHLRAENCAAIYFVRRPFMKLETRAIWFVNQSGEPMFKIFVGRNPDRSLKEDQVTRFDALLSRLS
ncbi:MAG: heme utilization cystosolic carrier protein HutX [Rhizomicrobium sp.]